MLGVGGIALLSRRRSKWAGQGLSLTLAAVFCLGLSTNDVVASPLVIQGSAPGSLSVDDTNNVVGWLGFESNATIFDIGDLSVWSNTESYTLIKDVTTGDVNIDVVLDWNNSSVPAFSSTAIIDQINLDPANVTLAGLDPSTVTLGTFSSGANTGENTVSALYGDVFPDHLDQSVTDIIADYSIDTNNDGIKDTATFSVINDVVDNGIGLNIADVPKLSIPEPATAVMVAVSSLALFNRRRRLAA